MGARLRPGLVTMQRVGCRLAWAWRVWGGAGLEGRAGAGPEAEFGPRELRCYLFSSGGNPTQHRVFSVSNPVDREALSPLKIPTFKTVT